MKLKHRALRVTRNVRSGNMKQFLTYLLLLLAIAFPMGIKATPQVQDKIIINGDHLALYYQFPLEEYLWSDANLGADNPFSFGWTESHCTRGYVATYEIRESKLCLIKIEKRLPVKEAWWKRWKKKEDSIPSLEWRELPLSIVFPEAEDSVFAEWYSETLIIPHGNLIESPEQRDRTYFDHEIHIVIELGVVKSITSVVHPNSITSKKAEMDATSNQSSEPTQETLADEGNL